MKIKINYSVFFFWVVISFGFSFLLKAQNENQNQPKNNTEIDIFYQNKINSFWQNNQIDSTLFFYNQYLAVLNPKKETEKYTTFQIQLLKLAYMIGKTEVIEKSIQELKSLKLNPKKEIDLIHQITFQEGKYEYWKGFYEKAVDVFEKIPTHKELKIYHLANRYANVADKNLDFLEIEKFENSKFETASEQTEMLSQLFILYAMDEEALSFAQKSIDYLPSRANEIEKANAQMKYVRILLTHQLKVKESEIHLATIEKVITKYASQTQLELYWQWLSINQLFLDNKVSKAEEKLDSVWTFCQQLTPTNNLLHFYIKLQSNILTRTNKWEKQEQSLNHYIGVCSEFYPQNSFYIQQLYFLKSTLYFYQSFYQKSIDYLDKISPNKIAVLLLKGDVYKLNAFAYFKLYDYDKAIFYIEEYLEIAENNFGKENVQVASIYSFLASIYREQGNYQQAVEYAKRSIEIYDTHKEKYSLAVVASHQVITNAYLKLEQPQKALFHSLEAKKIVEPVFLKTKFYRLAQTYSNLAVNYRSLENYDSAYHYYHLSLAAENSLPKEKRKTANIGRVYNNLGYAFQMQQNYDSAIFYYEKSLVEKEKSTQKWITANALNNLGNCLVAISDLKKAEENYKKSIERNRLGEEHADIETAIDSYKGLAALTNFSYYERLSYYRKADELIDKMRSQLYTDTDQLFVGKLTSEIYGKALSVCFEAIEKMNGEKQIYEDAFYFAEKNRAYLLRRQHQETLVLAQVPENLRKLDVNYSTLTDYYKREILNLENIEKQQRTEAQTSQLAYYNEQILETRNKHQDLKKELSNQFKSYKKLQEPIELVSTSTIKENLQENEQLIIYQWFEPYLFIQVISQTEQLFYRIKPTEFEETLKEYRNCLAKDCYAEKFVKQSNAIYEMLIQPIEVAIQESKKLVIIPDAILQQIPFSTLMNPSEQKNNSSYQNLNYSLLNYQISFHYSSSLWVSERQNKRQQKELNYEYEFVGLAPIFEENKNNSLVASNRNSLSPLPYSKQEVEEVANLFIIKDKKALALTNQEANQENLKHYATKTRRLHLATHSQTFTQIPFNSHLWLFGKDSTNNFELALQQIYASDLYGMSFPNELVVLSSCRSGVGQVVEGEGVITLTRSFLNAGTKNIIFSLWQIDDLATKELMRLFYEAVSENKTYSESLQIAKQKMAQSDKFKNPFYWAGILLVGE